MDLKTLIPQKLKEKFPKVDFEVSDYKDELTIKLDKNHIVDVCSYLKSEPDFEFLQCIDVTAVDWATRKNRFTVVYNIFSLKHNFRLRLKCEIDESDCSINSVSSVWRSSTWHERETYDMYGITFNNHPDLRRMYMPEDFEHHPLKKDFPLMGIPGSLPLPKK